MIKYLDGMHETPDYRAFTHLVLYRNIENDDYPEHWHFPIEIIMPVDKNYIVNADNKTYILKPNDILYVGPGVIHSISASPNGLRYIFQIDISRIKSINGINQILTIMGNSALFTSEQNPELHQKLVSIMEEIIEDYFSSPELTKLSDMDASESSTMKSNLCEPMIYGKLLNFLTLIGREYLDSVDSIANENKAREHNQAFTAVCHYIDEHFTEDISLDSVAAMAGFSKYHFSRLFKQYTNVSFYKYVNQQRIAYSEQLLSTSDYSITTVAMKSGYSSSSAFIRMFKQFKNCTPTEYKKIYEQSIPITLAQENTKSPLS